MRSHAGSIILNGASLINNEYAFIAAAVKFSLTSSAGQTVNDSSDIYALGESPSYIQSDTFENSCKSEKFQTGTCMVQLPNFDPARIAMYADFNTSDKAKIYSKGDLHFDIQQTPVIKGSDVTSGGSIIINTPEGNFNVRNVCNFIPQIAAHDKIIVNGRDIGIKGALFLAGYGIILTASGQISVINPSGNQSVIPPKGAINIPLRDIAQRIYSSLLTRPLLVPDAGITAAHHFIMDPTNGMRRLFMGRAPNPLKKLVLDMNLMSVIPLVLTDMMNIFGTQALNPHRMLALMNENAKTLSGTQLAPTNIPNMPLMYFEIKDVDDATEIAEPYLHITTDMMRNALTTNVGIICENGTVSMRAHDIYLDRAQVSGTDVEVTALKDETLKNARVTAIGSAIAAKDRLQITAPDGIKTNAAFDVSEHRTGGHDQYTRIQTAEILPTILSGKQITLDGASSQLRGTIVKAKELLDTTETLTIGVNKQRLEYESYKKKHGFLSSSSIHHTGWHEIVAPSALQVEKMLSAGSGDLEFESVLAGKLQQLLAQRSRLQPPAVHRFYALQIQQLGQ